MSSMTISVPLVPAAAMAPLAAAMGAGIAGLGLAAGAYLAAKQLKSNYDCALAEFAARTQRAEAERQAWNQVNQGQIARATELAGLVVGKADAGAAAQFVTTAIQEAIKLTSRPDLAEMNAKAQDLQRRLQSGERVEDLGDDAIRIGNEIHRRLSQAAERGAESPEVVALLQSVRLELTQLSESNERDAILSQLDKLDTLADSEPRVALQGIENVRERISRLAGEQFKRESDRAQRRLIAADAVALLQALMQVENAPEQTEAVELLGRLGEMFSAEEPPSLEELHGVRAIAKSLFDQCQTRLDNAAKSAYIADSVADTLMEMGYKVSHVRAEKSDGCMISVNAETGMLVTIDSAGQLRTEMVAFEQSAVHPNGAVQDHVCKLVDQILDGLRKREIEVREKSRRTTKSHEQIRVVERPEQTQALREAAKPLEKVIG